MYRNVEWWKIEKDMNVQTRFKNWNMSAQRWLQNCVFFRVKPFVGYTQATLLTFIISLLWHGFYLMWYIGFGVSFFTISNQVFINSKRAQNVLGKLPYSVGVVFMVISQLYYCIMFNFSALNINYKEYEETLFAMRGTYYISLWPIGVQLLLPYWISFLEIIMGIKREKKEEINIQKKID